MQVRTKAGAVAVAVAAVMVVAGCGGGGDDESGTSGGDAAADVDLPELEITDGDGASAVVGSEIPDDLPDVVMIPEGFAPINVTRQERDGEVNTVMIGSASGDAASVVAAVEDAYDAEPERTEVGGGVTLTYADVGGTGVEYSVLDNADGVANVTIVVGPVEG